MAQDFKRFEQGRAQRTVLPGGLIDHHLEQPTLLCGGLLQEQLARPASQPQHIDGLILRGRRGLPDIVDLALQPILLAMPNSRMLVEKLPGDAPVELVEIHRLNACLDLIAAGLPPFDGLFAGGVLIPVGLKHCITKPF